MFVQPLLAFSALFMTTGKYIGLHEKYKSKKLENSVVNANKG